MSNATRSLFGVLFVIFLFFVKGCWLLVAGCWLLEKDSYAFIWH